VPTSSVIIARTPQITRQVWNILPSATSNNGVFDISSGLDLHITGPRVTTRTITYWQDYQPFRQVPTIFGGEPPYITQDILRYPVENRDDYPQFGRSIGIFGNRMVVGAPMDDRTFNIGNLDPADDRLLNRGAAFAYFRSDATQTWEWIQ